MSETHLSHREVESQDNEDSIQEVQAFCAKCNKSFATTNRLIRHELRSHSQNYTFKFDRKDRPFQCFHCPAAFKQKFEKNKHERNCILKLQIQTSNQVKFPYSKYVCKSEPFNLSSKSSQKCINISTSSQQSSCTETKTRRTRRGVEFVFANELYCSYCPKLLTSLRGKNVHEQIHTGESPYQCKSCKTSFQLQCHLSTHEKKCNELFGLIWCPFCDFYSKSEFLVERHCRKWHAGYDLNKSNEYLLEEQDGTSNSECIDQEDVSGEDEEMPIKKENMLVAVKPEPFYWSQSFVIEDDDD